jgi:alkanesulfonate monooxygenase SsuD/methylene tetrahydromethanopterin reductase-like flavin-dependent oxidoreductase (luciferase family)
MRFGFFDQLPCPDGFTERQRYKDILAQIDLADALGFDTAWLGEIHFIRQFSILSDPLMTLAAAAQRTHRIRLRTAVTLLPLHSPIKIAEEAAICDILSDGRLEFGVGRGIARHYPSYGIPPEESRGRFNEALDFIIAAWTNETFSFAGRYFQARDLALVPRPVQTPHPPVRIAANSPDTFPLAAERRLPLFASPLINPPDKLKAGLAVYRDSLPTGYHGDTALAFPLHVAASREAARQQCEPGLMRFLHVAIEAALPQAQDPANIEAFRDEVRERLSRVTFADMDREIGVFGDPAYCVERIRALQEEYGFDEFIGYFNQGGLMDPELVRATMKLFAETVMPLLR